ncbi:MAG TPA: YsnF/AvaK domain-containing protein, partial [Propionibacteriaceae bacterium]|nr:YsnF/AvaK domain-containing protein [Propionibacteriaceae bacterium]
GGVGYARAEDRDVDDSVAPRSDAAADYERSDRDDTTVGRDVSGQATDDAMTLSEEQVRVGTQTEEVGRARLRKYVVTENVTQTVPVTREEVRVEREPITEANRDEALSGPDLSEQEHEVVLHEERPVVEKQTVPVERVRLDTETVTDQVTVSEEVRKEELDTDLDGDDRGTDPATTDRPGR